MKDYQTDQATSSASRKKIIVQKIAKNSESNGITIRDYRTYKSQVANDPDVSQLLKSIEKERIMHDKSTDMVIDHVFTSKGIYNHKIITPWEVSAMTSDS